MKVEDINKRVKELNKLKKLLNTPINEDDSVEEKVFKKYLEVESVSEVAKYINALGYRIDNRKYIANDISSMITSKNIMLKNKELQVVVMKLFKSHKKGIRKSKW